MLGVWGELARAIKDALTHRPGSQGWAPSVLLSCHVMCNLCMCFVWIFWGLWIYVGGFIYLFLYLSIYLPMLINIISCIHQICSSPFLNRCQVNSIAKHKQHLLSGVVKECSVSHKNSHNR